jgi:hypothetical protein
MKLSQAELDSIARVQAVLAREIAAASPMRGVWLEWQGALSGLAPESSPVAA